MLYRKEDVYQTQTHDLSYFNNDNNKIYHMSNFNFTPSFTINLIENTNKTKLLIDEDDDIDIYDGKIA